MTAPVQTAQAYHYRHDQAGVPEVLRSARVIVPILHKLFRPSFVVDVGCGTGDWLSVWTEQGDVAIRGFDGPWVPPSGLMIDSSFFVTWNLNETPPPLPKCDLAMCLEVAEHLNSSAATGILDALCAAAPVIVWSAAVPGQGGYGHINERYQHEWVAEFAKRCFEPVDLIRPQVWLDERVSWWYQQNLLVFVHQDSGIRLPPSPLPIITSIIHPSLYEQASDPRNYSLRRMLPHLGHYLRKSVAHISDRLIPTRPE